MRRTFLAAVASLLFARSTEVLGAPAPRARSARTVSYAIQARLDPKAHEVLGTETFTWRNDSRVAVDRLPLHLYLDAFRNEETTWLREGRSTHRGYDLDTFGEIRVERLACGGRDLLALARHEETLLWVPLDPAVPPGGEVSCAIEFVSVLPRVFARTGYVGDFHFVGQWFPKPAVLGDDGRLRGHAFHLATEFFADYATFDVTISVPRGFTVGATGRLVERSEASGGRPQRLRFRAEDVHDFAWTASPHFATIATSAGRTRLTTLHYPAQRTVAARQHEAVAAALVHFGRAYGEYPYDTLTLVVPPPGAGGAGGMEYPTLITGSGGLFVPRGFHEAEGTAVHEFGHQYFYGLLGSNEFESAWLDEGLTTYASNLFMERRYGRHRSLVDWGPFRFGVFALSRLAHGFEPVVEPLETRSWEFASSRSYGIHAYSRADLALRTLRGRVGRRAMERALQTYAVRRRFTHPTADDLFADLSDVLGTAPVDATLRAIAMTPAWVDYEVVDVACEERRRGRGTFDADGGPRTVEDGGPVEPAEYESSVLVARRGTLRLPVDVRVEFDDGSRLHERWDGQGTHARFTYRGTARAVAAEVDPDRRVAYDADLRNNGRGARPGGANHVLFRVAYVVGTLLQVVGP